MCGCLIKFSKVPHKRYIENSEENMHVDIGASRVKRMEGEGVGKAFLQSRLCFHSGKYNTHSLHKSLLDFPQTVVLNAVTLPHFD